MDIWKKYAAAACAALTLCAPVVAEAHWLSSAQEKEIGTQAANDFAAEYPVSHNWVLDHIQNRLMAYNPDKLWMYGTPGKKRGLEPVLMAKNDLANAVSYGGGQIFVYEGMFDHLASKVSGAFSSNPNEMNPWKKSNIYQMSAMAAVVGHEIGHWENEDMLDQYDADMALRFVAGAIPIGNVWTLLGVTAGANLINAFSSRQMSFDSEKHADEKSMEYAMYVPEYSVGGEAIVEFREYNFKTMRGQEDKVTNWLHPHSKTAKRLERALHRQEELSRGFIKWDGLAPIFNGYPSESYLFASKEKEDFDGEERTFYVLGQIATAIHFDFCKLRNLRVEREDVVFTDGSPNNVVLILEGHGNDHQDHVKIVDTYYGIPLQKAKLLIEYPWDTYVSKYGHLLRRTEAANLAYTRSIIDLYEFNRAQYVHKPVE